MKVGTMPLPMDLVSLPLYFWESCQGVRFDLARGDLDLTLPLARAGTLFFWWLLLIYGWLAGRQLAGPWGGRLAVAFLACEPCLLAHASLATKDIAISACLLALVYHYAIGRHAGAWRGRILPAFWFGASLLAKASALAFGPLCLLAVEGYYLALEGAISSISGPLTQEIRPSWWRRIWLAWRPFRRDFTWIFAGGLALALVYCGCDWKPLPSFVAWARNLPDDNQGRAMVWLAEHLPIFSNAAEGLVRQVMHNVRGHDGSYLLGAVDRRAFWYYFPMALTMKLSLPLLAMPILLTLVRPRSLINWACLAALGLLVYSLNCRVQIGIRLVLPLVAFAIVGLAAGLARLLGERDPVWRHRLLVGGVCAGLAWTALAALRVWPNALCYTNELWGGTSQGYLCLSDSNYDWGQGLKELARWRQKHGLDLIDVWYFGTDPALKNSGFHELPLHNLPINRSADVVTQTHGRYLAVSTTLLYGAYGMIGDADTPFRRSITFLRSQRPVDRTSTFLIYDFTQTASAQ
jgi:hypothetical protein